MQEPSTRSATSTALVSTGDSSRRDFLRGALLTATAAAGAPLLQVADVDAAGQTGETRSGGASNTGMNSVVTVNDNQNVVETAYGKVRGLDRNGIKIFRGIPYGADTSGQNRFLPAKPPAPWKDVRSALWFGPVTPWWQGQRPEWEHDERAFVLQLRHELEGEDLLRINIWTPAINDGKKRPVLFYIHGGGFSWGSGYEHTAYDGENLARRGDIVVVNFTHRLSTFGFLDLSELDPERYATSGNLGMTDIVFALKWVQDSISNFGGDPSNVTIAGQSGGGGKVSTLLGMPSAAGLFRRAAIHSGASSSLATKESSLRLAAAVLAELGITKGNSARLHELTIPQLLVAAKAALPRVNQRATGEPAPAPPGARVGFGPSVDGVVIPYQLSDPAAMAISAKIPLMVGQCLNETTDAIDKPEAFKMTVDELTARLQPVYGARTQAVIDTFRQDYPNVNNYQLFSAIVTTGPGAGLSRIGTVEFARRWAQQGTPVYLWWWKWQSPVLGGRVMAPHSGDLSFFFDNTERSENLTGNTPEARHLAAQMSEAWIHFARSGNPSHPGIPNWKPVTPDGSQTMTFDAPTSYSDNPDGRLREIIQRSLEVPRGE
jgi:para-nitrobenzyl esterase